MPSNNNDLIILDENIIKKHHQERAPHLSNDEYFEIFAAEQILKNYDPSYEELLEGQTGGSLDGGIDSIYTFINGTLISEEKTHYKDYLSSNVKIDLYIIQSKNKSNFEEAVVDKLQAATEDLLDLSQDLSQLTTFYNETVLELIQRFRDAYQNLAHTFPDVSISYFYASKAGKPTDNMLRKSENLCHRAKVMFSGAKVSFSFVGATEMLQLARTLPRTTLILKTAESPVSPEDSSSFVCLVKLVDYYNFITGGDGANNLQSRLFESNVRDWQGNIKVNKQIEETLNKNDSEDFWWLNNGVTILSTRANMSSGRILHIDNPQIVNGLQTSRAIYNYLSKKNAREDNRKLLVRVIVPEQNDSRENIIRATNSQTTVPEAALRSFDKIHHNIENYFSVQTPPLYYDRRKNYYKNLGKPISQIIGIRQLAQVLISILLLRPDDAKQRPSDYLTTAEKDKYESIFNEEYDLSLYYFSAMYLNKVTETLKRNEIDSAFDNRTRRLLMFHIMTYSIVQFLGYRPNKNVLGQQIIADISDHQLIDSANEVLNFYKNVTQSNPSFKWKDFEDQLLVKVKKDFNLRNV